MIFSLGLHEINEMTEDGVQPESRRPLTVTDVCDDLRYMGMS